MPASPDTGVRPYLLAFLVATVVVLVVDGAMQLAMDAIRVSTYGRAPWWVTANIVERGRWVAFALCLWWIGPRMIDGTADAWRQVGMAVVAVPVLWIVATWAVSAIRFTLLGTWDSDGRVFVNVDYYSRLAVDLAPWLLAGAAVMATARHVD